MKKCGEKKSNLEKQPSTLAFLTVFGITLA
jgi:hypothetical protein